MGKASPCEPAKGGAIVGMVFACGWGSGAGRHSSIISFSFLGLVGPGWGLGRSKGVGAFVLGLGATGGSAV